MARHRAICFLRRNPIPLEPVVANAFALQPSRYIGRIAMHSTTNPFSAKFGDKPRLNRPLVLVGMMGVGKSTVGRQLGHALGLEFIDSDDEITIASGMSIAEIFDRFGEDYFRDGERRVLSRLIESGPKVIATGGGAFINEATRALIKEKCLSVWIDADIDLLVARVSRKSSRPLLIGKDPRTVLTELGNTRNPIYALADLHVRSDSAPHTKTTELILKAIASCTG
jgi:shikimate kinase